VNLEVAGRLIGNLEAERIAHNQDIWMQDHTDVFVISVDDRWSCATSACAAGFIFLEEAPSGFVFNSSNEMVYDSVGSMENDRMSSVPVGRRIDRWAGDVLGISKEDQYFLFYSGGDTEDTINRIRFLMLVADRNDYDSSEDY
jgi:hypothetical protein